MKTLRNSYWDSLKICGQMKCFFRLEAFALTKTSNGIVHQLEYALIAMLTRFFMNLPLIVIPDCVDLCIIQVLATAKPWANIATKVVWSCLQISNVLEGAIIDVIDYSSQTCERHFNVIGLHRSHADWKRNRAKKSLQMQNFWCFWKNIAVKLIAT